VRRGLGGFVVGQQFLVQLLAGAQAGEGNRDLGLALARQRISMRASSTIFTGSPMSSTKIWPDCPISPACSTSCAASGMVMK
jgi:hypothetical protein